MNACALADLPVRFFGGQDRLKGPLPAELRTDSYGAEIVGFPPRGIFDQAGLLRQIGVLPSG